MKNTVIDVTLHNKKIKKLKVRRLCNRIASCHSTFQSRRLEKEVFSQVASSLPINLTNVDYIS